MEKDIFTSIEEKEELLKEASEIVKDEENVNVDALSNLRKKWKRIPQFDSAKEEELEEAFQKVLDVVYSKKNELLKSAKEAKESIIKQAEEIKSSKAFGEATKKMNDLLEAWKQTGRTDKETDDALWDRFNTARQEFFNNKREYVSKLKENFANAKEIKEKLIVEAEKIKDSTTFKETSAKFDELMEQWKAAGSAGKEFEDELWSKFQAHRKAFNEAKSAYYDDLRKTYDERLAAKKVLIEKAKAIVETNIHTKENAELLKGLREEWKAIGSCGKNNEDSVWSEFNGYMDTYYQGLTAEREAKHAAWVDRMNQAKANKLALVEKQKALIERLEREKSNTLGESGIKDLEDEIADKLAFIKELEQEAADIEKTLAEDTNK